MEFVARWSLKTPFLTAAPALPGASTVEGPDALLDPDTACLRWSLISIGRCLALKVGPVRPGQVQAGLDLFHHWQGVVEASLSAEDLVGEFTGFRVRHNRGADVQRACEQAAPALVSLLGGQGMQIELEPESLELYLFQPLLAEVYDQAAPLASSILRLLIRDPGPPGLLPRFPELVSRADDGRTLVVAPDEAPVPPESMSALLDYVGGIGLLTRPQRDATRRMRPLTLEEPDLVLQPAQSPPDQTAPAAPDVVDPDGEDFGPLTITPFLPGTRPLDEARQPGAGSSEAVGFLSSDPAARSQTDEGIWLLFRVEDAGLADADDLEVTLSAWFLPPSGAPVPVPGLEEVAVPPRRVAPEADPLPALLEAGCYEPGASAHYVASIAPQDQLLPRGAAGAGGGWRREHASPALRSWLAEGDDPFSLTHGFSQRLRVALTLRVNGEARARRRVEVQVFDVQRLGSLYLRLITQLIDADTRQQADDRGLHRLYQAYHPWYPVVSLELARLRHTLKAIQTDLALQQAMLPDPGWMLRVLLYQELITCLSIFTALGPDRPDLLSPEERRALAISPALAPVRERLEPDAWSKVWERHTCLPRKTSLSATGPVDFRNLVEKRDVALAFLHGQRRSLEAALTLAGPCSAKGREAWQRLYRDAERALLSTGPAAFPELRHLSPGGRQLALWHQKGAFAHPALKLVPRWLTDALGDQDAIYPAATRAYREAFNTAAAWASSQGLQDPGGDPCLSAADSLIEARLEGEEARFASLQSRDGYGAVPEEPSGESWSESRRWTVQRAADLLRTIKVFEPLTTEEIRELAHRLRPLSFAAGEVLLTQGERGTSLLIIDRGAVAVTARQEDGSQLPVARLTAGAVVGELALLTGEERSATVRAVESVRAYEITREDLLPLVDRRPQVILAMSLLLASRQAELRDKSEQYLFGARGKPLTPGRLARLIRGVLGE